jgi:hypothetical protein
MNEPQVIIPRWLPIPGAPYRVDIQTLEVRSLVRTDDRQRRVGGRTISASARGTMKIRYPSPVGAPVIRERSLRALRAEAVEAWLEQHPEVHVTQAAHD